ncbi:SRPBCC domain-containing protein [bacterium]|nr:SRPBCC domain-containing protein [bacterium]
MTNTTTGIALITAFVLLLTMFVMIEGNTFRKEIRTDIVIRAPKHIVWNILSDFDNYSDWNPYHVRVERLAHRANSTNIEQHDRIQVFIHKPNGDSLDLEAEITRLDPGLALYWGEGLPGIFSGEHRFILEEIDSVTTRVRHDEDFWGLALPVVPLGAEYIEQGYNEMNIALKHIAEQQFAEAEQPQAAAERTAR